MTVSFEKTSDTKGTLSFSIDQETIKTGLDKAFNKVKANISVPGFRKGKSAVKCLIKCTVKKHFLKKL